VIAYRVLDAVAVSGISRANLYRRLKSGELRSVFVAGRRLIPAAALREFLSGGAGQ
jgi:excisionase family DNA binding protein